MEPPLTRSCVRCRATAPSTDTEYTLISQKHGWRCRKVENAGGVPRLEWYCDSCWKGARVGADKPK